ncbi:MULTISPECIES: carbohydrate ABC transporter permease [Methylobacterium]|uniref:carbohydrate ABC transporter permease n=1 Tax=Methylobacterium TaxID=407 RepID=UPI0013E9BEE5|nr:sugar ABC transporter permease [Methylobacterium sp. DB0501]NGM38080.1 sugar ABC transporter permease [Methylobacterium sp. DB0501]
MTRRVSAALQGWLLLMPAMLLLVAFTHWPALASLFESVTSTARPRRPSHFVGAANFEQMWADPVFWQSLTNNLWFAAATIPLSIGLALLMAVWVNDRIPGRTFARMAYFTPTILPMIAAGNIWLFFYTPQYGLLEQITGALGFPSHNWLGSADTALAAVTLVAVWKEAGFFMIFYLAALQAIPPVLAEAAALEGASRWTYCRRVQLPLLMPTTLFVLINAVINAFRTADLIIVMTRGGPDNATSLLLFHIYQVGFTFWDTSYAAALTLVLIALLAVVALVQYGWLERKVHYQ